MEFLALIGLAAIAYGLWLWFRFNNFRNRLFKAFEHYGVNQFVANNLYTTHNAVINDLHINRGLSPELIAVAILEEYGRV